MILQLLKISFFIVHLVSGIGKLSQIYVDMVEIGQSDPAFIQLINTSLKEAEKRTSLMIFTKLLKKDFDKSIFDSPFLILNVNQAFTVTKEKVLLLKEFIFSGGFLWIVNSSSPEKRFASDNSIRKLVHELFPDENLKKIPKNNILYRSFYALTDMEGLFVNEGIFVEGELIMVYTPLQFGGISETVVEFVINVIEYGVCSDYKNEQIHLDYILKKRRWKLNE